MYLLDSSILIDYLNRVPAARQWLMAVDVKDVSISAVTLSEVLSGCQSDERELMLLFAEKSGFYDIGKEEAMLAADLRQAHRLKLPDAFQAALAIKHKMILITRNTKDFPPKKFSFVKIPYTL